MRKIIFLLLLLPLSWTAGFGRSVLEIERVWNITSQGPYNFTGALAVNDSNQHIISITTEPEATIMVKNDTVFVNYEGNGNTTLHANAVMMVEYRTNITSDPPLPAEDLQEDPQAGGLTAFDDAIKAQATELATKRSVLSTIRDLVNWVHSNITYDLNYSDRGASSAIEVFKERRGVCVEYSHLLISMLRSLGLKSRYVSGYVLAESWQPHAWAEVEVPDYGWLPVDPTIGQVGILDNTHIAVQKNQDQSQAYDILMLKHKGGGLSVTDSITSRYMSENPGDVSLKMDFDAELLTIEVSVHNTLNSYVYGVYAFNTPLPVSHASKKPYVMLLKPGETVQMYYGLNRSLFNDGFVHHMQFKASFNDASEKKVFSIDQKAGKDIESVPDSSYVIPDITAIIAIMVVLIVIVMAMGRK